MALLPAFDHTGPYIWAAYGLSALVFLGLLAVVLARAGAARTRLERLEREEESRP